MYLQLLVYGLDVVQSRENFRRGSVDAEVGQGYVKVLVVVAVHPGREIRRAERYSDVVHAGGVCAVRCCELGMNVMLGWYACELRLTYS